MSFFQGYTRHTIKEICHRAPLISKTVGQTPKRYHTLLHKKMASLHFRKILLYFIAQTLSESHMQLHESLTDFSLKHPGELYCFRMEHRGCNSILLKWGLEQFEPVLSFFCVQVRFMPMQSLMLVCWMWNSRHWIMGFEELSCFWENLWWDCHKWNCDFVWSFLLLLYWV